MANGMTPGTNGRTAYHATARRDGGQGWTVTVEGAEGVSGFMVDDLSDVEATTRRHIFGWSDHDLADIDVTVRVQIPADVEQRLDVAEQLVEDAGKELLLVANDLFGLGCVPADLRWIINHRPLTLDVVATVGVPNAEIADLGLSLHPNATGARWSDNGFAETVKCRDCVERTRAEYAAAGDAGSNTILFGEVVCDFCDVGHPPPHITFGPDGTPRRR